MSWLRVDDKLVRHPKITSLSRGDRWTWIELLSYCAEYQTEGHVPTNVRAAVPHATPGLLAKAHAAGLLDINGSGYVVHNWGKYNPKDATKAERQARWRHNRDANVDGGVDASVDTNVDASRVGAGARPVPSPTQTPEVGTSLESVSKAVKNPRPPSEHEVGTNGLGNISEIIEQSLREAAHAQPD